MTEGDDLSRDKSKRISRKSLTPRGSNRGGRSNNNNTSQYRANMTYKRDVDYPGNYHKKDDGRNRDSAAIAYSSSKVKPKYRPNGFYTERGDEKERHGAVSSPIEVCQNRLKNYSEDDHINYLPTPYMEPSVYVYLHDEYLGGVPSMSMNPFMERENFIKPYDGVSGVIEIDNEKATGEYFPEPTVDNVTKPRPNAYKIIDPNTKEEILGPVKTIDTAPPEIKIEEVIHPSYIPTKIKNAEDKSQLGETATPRVMLSCQSINSEYLEKSEDAIDLPIEAVMNIGHLGVGIYNMAKNIDARLPELDHGIISRKKDEKHVHSLESVDNKADEWVKESETSRRLSKYRIANKDIDDFDSSLDNRKRNMTTAVMKEINIVPQNIKRMYTVVELIKFKEAMKSETKLVGLATRSGKKESPSKSIKKHREEYRYKLYESKTRPKKSFRRNDKMLSPRAKKDIDVKERFKRNVKALLNKLTVDNFELIMKDIALLLEVDNDEHNVRSFGEIFWKKATSEVRYHSMYADALEILVGITSDLTADKEINREKGVFWLYITDQCQEASETILRLEGDIDDATKYGYMNKLKFVAQTYLRRLVAMRILPELILGYLSRERPSEFVVECFAELLMTIGRHLDAKRDFILKIQNYFEMYVFQRVYSARINYKLQNWLDLSSKHWEMKTFTEDPKALHDIRKEHESNIESRTITLASHGIRESTVGYRQRQPYDSFYEYWSERVQKRRKMLFQRKKGILPDNSRGDMNDDICIGLSLSTTGLDKRKFTKDGERRDETQVKIEMGLLKNEPIETYLEKWEDANMTREQQVNLFIKLLDKMAGDGPGNYPKLLAEIIVRNTADRHLLLDQVTRLMDNINEWQIDNPDILRLLSQMYSILILKNMPIDELESLNLTCLHIDTAKQVMSHVLEEVGKTDANKVSTAIAIFLESYVLNSRSDIVDIHNKLTDISHTLPICDTSLAEIAIKLSAIYRTADTGVLENMQNKLQYFGVPLKGISKEAVQRCFAWMKRRRVSDTDISIYVSQLSEI